MTDEERRITEEDARRLWRRAAELQAEAARRLEERSRSLAGGEEEGEGEGDVGSGGYRLEDVRAAAVEAGISEEFVGQALAEEAVRGTAVARGRSDDLADRFLGPGPDALVVSRVYDAPPEEVYPVLQRVLPAPPLELGLRDNRGGHPLEGGVLIFDVPPLTVAQGQNLGYELRGWADVREVHMALRPVGDDGRRTEVALRAPLDHSRRVNLWVGGGLVAVVGAPVAGLSTLGAVAAASATGLAATLVVLVAVLVGVGGFGLTAVAGAHGWRALYAYGLGRGERALEDVLARVGVHLTTSAGLAPGESGWPSLPGR